MELTEQQVWILLKKGDESAFEMVFKAHYQALCNYAYTFLRDRDEAEEVVQSAYMVVWEKRESLDIKVSLKSYLYQAVRNSCLNVIKHSRVKRDHATEMTVTSERAQDSVIQSVQSSELESRIASAIQTLPEQCRLIFKMSRFEELKYNEIAKHLNISIKTVENQMGKALRIMREQLSEFLPVLIIIAKILIEGR